MYQTWTNKENHHEEKGSAFRINETLCMFFKVVQFFWNGPDVVRVVHTGDLQPRIEVGGVALLLAENTLRATSLAHKNTPLKRKNGPSYVLCA